MVSEIAAFLGLYSLFRTMKTLMIRIKGKKKRKIIPGAEPFLYKKGKTGVLLIHGFTSSPSDMRDIGAYLAERNITVSAPLIEGHGTSPYNLALTNWKDWVGSMDRALKELKKECSKVFVGGVSIGGSIALYLAARHNVDGVISLGTPIYFRKALIYRALIPFVRLFKSFQKKWYRGLVDPEIQKKRIGYDVIPLGVVRWAVALVEESKKSLPKISAPSLIMMSTKDFGVDKRTVDYLYRNINSLKKRIVWIDDAYHVLVVDKKKEESFREVYNFIREN